MSQILLNAAQRKIRENKWFLSSKNGIFFFWGGEQEREKKMKGGKKLYSTAIYNLPPRQRHRIIMETNLEK